MHKLLDQYIALVFQHQNTKTEDLLNYFIQKLKPEEIKMMAGKTPLFLHTAFCVRNSSSELQEYVKKDLKRNGFI